MRTPTIIIGAGGFGRGALDVLRAADRALTTSGEGRNFLGFIDDGDPPADRLARLSARHIGGMEALSELPDGTEFVVGIGNGNVRRTLDEKACAAGLIPTTLIHPDATVGEGAEIEEGVVICSGARVATNARLGRHVHLNLNTTVGHDAVLRDFVTTYPLAAISGDVTIHEATTVGTTACINQGLVVGAASMIASGAAVIKNVPDGVLVAGCPATVKKGWPQASIIRS